MRKWVVLFCWLVLSTGIVFAQDSPSPFDPIGTLEAGDFRALAVTADGGRLLVADAATQQVRIYDFSDPSNPALLSTLEVSGTPLLLAGGDNYGLVAVSTSGDTDSIEVIAPALPGTPFSPGYNYIDIPKNPRALALSPDHHWGVVVGEQGYVLLGINDPGNIDNFPVAETIIDAALSNTTAYFLRDQVLAAAPLGGLEAMQAEKELGLDGAPSAVALNAATTEGVVVLDGNRLAFFDPATLTLTGTVTVDGSPITDVQFLSKDSAEYLLVSQQDSRTITVLDTSDPKNINSLPNGETLDKSIRAMTTFGQYVIATDGVTISIFSA